MINFRESVCSVLLLGLVSGCGSDLVAMNGTVMLEGEPLSSGTVVFRNGEKALAFGTIEADGAYNMQTGQEEGISPGVYQVTVSAFRTKPSIDGTNEPIPEFLTPIHYNRPETSGLEFEVGSGSTRFDINLTRAASAN